jgi:linoleate 10R-lipoxygenase
LATHNTARGEREQRNTLRAIADTQEKIDSVAKYFYDTTRMLIARHSYTLVGGQRKSVDIVRDVLKAVPIHWVATQLVRISDRFG